MDFLRRAAASEVRGTRPKPKEEGSSAAEEFMLDLNRDAEESWRRLGLRVLLAVQAARCQVVLQELAVVTAERNNKQPEQEDSNKYGVPREEILLRIPLAPSKSDKSRTYTPDQCAHRWLYPRGGKTYWYTCRQCPMRWPRLHKDEYCEDARTIPPDQKTSKRRA